MTHTSVFVVSCEGLPQFSPRSPVGTDNLLMTPTFHLVCIKKSAGQIDLLIRTQCLNFVDNGSILYWRSFSGLSNIPDRISLIGLQGSQH